MTKRTYVAKIKGEASNVSVLKEILGDEFELISVEEDEGSEPEPAPAPEPAPDLDTDAKQAIVELIQEELDDDEFNTDEEKKAFEKAKEEVELLFDLESDDAVTTSAKNQGCARPTCTSAVLNEVSHNGHMYCSFTCAQQHAHN